MEKFHNSDVKVELFPFLGFFKKKVDGCALKANMQELSIVFSLIRNFKSFHGSR